MGLSRSFSRTTLEDTDGFPSFCTMCGGEIVCVNCGEESVPGTVLEADDQDSLHSNLQNGGGQRS